MKKLCAMLMVVVIAMCLTACGSSSLSGEYTSESGIYSVDFEKNGSCVWYQNGMFFDGTYEKNDQGWILNVHGSGQYSNTTFQAEPNGKNLIITGGVVYDETFYKN